MRIFALPAFATLVLTGCPVITKADLDERIDQDDDGYVSAQFGGDDCDDANEDVNPGATDTPYDAVDADCSGGSDYDADGDGFDAASVDGAPDGGDDCDDTDAGVHPGAAEICDGADDDCDGVIGDPSSPETDESDSDGDGSFVCAGDCDDTNPGVHPGAAEICDDANTDEDCDGSIDDGDNGATGQTDWYLDSDHDGYGTAGTVATVCDAPADYVDNADDCDDGDPAINPDTPWYADSDEDGWGDDLDVVYQCTQPDGYVPEAGDCLDSDPTIHPEATESCNGIDDDCDGDVDADDLGVDPAEAVWYRDRDGDGYGDESATITTCTSSGGYVHGAGDCDDYVYTVNPGAPEICDHEDNDCDGDIDDADVDVTDMVTWYADDDGDGFGDAAWAQIACFEPADYVGDDTDCDDTEGGVNPDAQEVCDLIDNDCDALVDDDDGSVAPGVVTYTDSDGDGFGDPATTTTVCAPAASNVEVSGDCDDSKSAVNPSRTETCATAYDDDCSGDANDLGATSCTTRYRDGDGDSYGVADSECRCAAAGDYTAAVDTDCDDASPGDHPGATEIVGNGDDEDCDGSELCNDDADDDGYLDASGVTLVSTDTDCTDAHEGTDADPTTDCDDADPSAHPGAVETCNQVDDDCDGTADDGLATFTYFADSDGDGFGDAGVTIVRCSAPGSFVADGSDCDDTDDHINPGEVEVCENGLDDDCDGGFTSCLSSGSLSGADAQFTGQMAGDYAGITVANAGDVNGDGFGDMLVGAPGNDAAGSYAGAAYLILGGPAPGDLHLGFADAAYTGEASPDAAGMSVSGAGDVNGDGFDDMLVGASQQSDGGTSAGAVYLILGNDVPGDLGLGAADAEFVGASAGDHAGSATSSAGDFNGDGFDDVLIGEGAAVGYRGNACLLLGSASPASRSLEAADSNYVGEVVQDRAGSSVASGGDVDGDGLADIFVGAPGRDESRGAAYLVLGRAAPADLGLGGADAVYSGESAADYAGGAVAGAGDVNGDGFGDLLVGATGNGASANRSGAAYLILGGGSPASRPLAVADAKYEEGGGVDAEAGCSVASAGDVDADGFMDVLVGASYEGTGVSAGAAYLILGSPGPAGRSLSAADAVYAGEALDDFAGSSLSGGGDVDADGFADILIGARGSDDGGSLAGAAYLILGSGL